MFQVTPTTGLATHPGPGAIIAKVVFMADLNEAVHSGIPVLFTGPFEYVAVGKDEFFEILLSRGHGDDAARIRPKVISCLEKGIKLTYLVSKNDIEKLRGKRQDSGTG